jgi:transposase InsO family protein
MDIYSRKVVGWQVYDSESSDLASDVMRDICEWEDIAPDQVVLHTTRWWNCHFREKTSLRSYCRRRKSTSKRLNLPAVSSNTLSFLASKTNANLKLDSRTIFQTFLG